MLITNRRLWTPREVDEPGNGGTPVGGVTNPFPTGWSGPVVDVPTTATKYSAGAIAANTLLDARGSTLSAVYPGPNVPPQDEQINPASMRSSNNGINWYGGFIFYDVPVNLSYQGHYHPDGGYAKNSHGLLTGDASNATNAQNVRVTAMRGDNCWDCISHARGGHNFHVRGCYGTHIHDDWIENDTFCSGLIEDNLVDGAYYFYSSKSGNSSWMSPATPAQQTVTIQNNVVRIKPFPIDDGVTSPQGAGGLFKLHGSFGNESGTHTKLRILNNWFLLECGIRYAEFIGHSEDNKLGFPTTGGIMTECSGNHVVWVPALGGPSTFPGAVPSSGVTVYNGSQHRALWTAKRDTWLANHQEVDQRASVSST